MLYIELQLRVASDMELAWLYTAQIRDRSTTNYKLLTLIVLWLSQTVLKLISIPPDHETAVQAWKSKVHCFAARGDVMTQQNYLKTERTAERNGTDRFAPFPENANTTQRKRNGPFFELFYDTCM